MSSELQPIVEVDESRPGTMEFSIELPEEALRDEMEKEFRSLVMGAKVPGFRKGKAPRHLLEAKYREGVRSEALERIVSRTIWSTLEERKVVPFFDPELTKLEAPEGEPVRIGFIVDSWPDVELKKYRDFELRRPVREISDEDMERETRALQEANVIYVPVDRPAIRGDQLVVSYQRFLPGGAAFGKRKGDTSIVIGLEESPGVEGIIEKGLLAASPGGTRSVSVDFPESHPSAQVAGRTIEFRFDVKEVRERTLPPVNDEFASRILGDGEATLDLLSEKIREHLARQAGDEAERKLDEEILDRLIRENVVSISDRLLERVTESNLPPFPPEEGIPEDQREEAAKRKRAIVEHHRKGALRAIQKLALMTEIAGREKLEPEEREVEAMRRALAPKEDPTLSAEKRKEERGRMTSEIRRVLRDKNVFQWIKQNSTVP
ncbi:MAG: trigger factor [Candidatus Eisenbacteria bacterium]